MTAKGLKHMKITIKSGLIINRPNICFTKKITDKYGMSRWKSQPAGLIFRLRPAPMWKTEKSSKSVIRLLTQNVYSVYHGTAADKPVAYFIYKNIYQGNPVYKSLKASGERIWLKYGKFMEREHSINGMINGSIVRGTQREIKEPAIHRTVTGVRLFNRTFVKNDKSVSEKDTADIENVYHVSNYNSNQTLNHVHNNSNNHRSIDYNHAHDRHNAGFEEAYGNPPLQTWKQQHQQQQRQWQPGQEEQPGSVRNEAPAAAGELAELRSLSRRAGGILRTTAVRQQYVIDRIERASETLTKETARFEHRDVHQRETYLNTYLKSNLKQLPVSPAGGGMPELRQEMNTGLVFRKPQDIKQAPAAVQVPQKDVLTADRDVYAKVFTASKTSRKPEPIGNEEVRRIAEKVYAIIEKKMEIQKDRRGL